MSQIEITVDLSRCQGYANCVSAAPDLFDLDDSGLVKLLEDSPSADRLSAAQEAERLCPAAAIVVKQPG